MLTETTYSPSIGDVDEPITVTQAKRFLNLPEYSPADTEQDEELELLVGWAREIAEEEWGGDIKLKQYCLTADCWPYCEFVLRRPLNSVDLIRYRDEDGNWNTLTVNTDYIVDTTKGIVTLPVGGGWPTAALWPTSAIEIYFSAGYSSYTLLPKKLKQGIQFLIAHGFSNKLPVQAMAGTPQEVPLTVTRALRGAPRP